MVLDLNRILPYSNLSGAMHPAVSPRKYFSIVDGIFSMEGNGPLSGTRKKADVLIAGSNPVCVDAVCARLMGFDYLKIPMISRAFEPHPFPLVRVAYRDICPVSNVPAWNKCLDQWLRGDLLNFRPPFGWRDAILEEI
jgi:hypothetical protein